MMRQKKRAVQPGGAPPQYQRSEELGGATTFTLEATSTQISDPEPAAVSLKKAKRELLHFDGNCFGCVVGFHPPEDKSDVRMGKLWASYYDNIQRLKPEILYKLVSETQHKHFIEPFENDDEQPFMEWPPEMIEEHVTNHHVYYDQEVVSDIRHLKELEEFLEDNIGSETATGGVKPNKESIELYLKVIDKKESIIARWERERQGRAGVQ